MNLGCLRKRAQVAGICSEDVVAVSCQAHHSGINGIGLATAGKEHAGSASQPFVDGSHVSAIQEPGHGDLPSAATTPDLLDPLLLRIDRAAGRSAGDASSVEKRHGVHASAPVFAGTRIRVATVKQYLQQGYHTDAVLQAFPDLKVEDVDEARRQLAAAG